MKIGEYEFSYVGDIEPLREPGGAVRQFLPQGRYANARNIPLNQYGAGPFCKFTIPKRFRTSGVYLLTIDGKIRYVGECADPSARFSAGYGNISPRNCFQGGQETNCRLNNLVYLAHGCSVSSLSTSNLAKEIRRSSTPAAHVALRRVGFMAKSVHRSLTGGQYLKAAKVLRGRADAGMAV